MARLLGVLLLFSLLPYTSVAESEPTDAIEAISNYFEQLGAVRTRQKPYYYYHYVTKPALNVASDQALDPTNPKVSKHVETWAAYFWDYNQVHDGAETKGLYLASDPVASRSWGNAQGSDRNDLWVLYRVEIPRGMRTLDLMSIYGETAYRDFPDSILKKIRDSGCQLKTPEDIMRKTSCTSIQLGVLKKLNVDAIEYSFSSALFKGCSTRKDNAIILLRPEKLNPDAVRIFSAEPPTGADDRMEAGMIAETFRATEKKKMWGLATSGSVSQIRALTPWSNKDSGQSVIPRPSSGDFSKWIESHLEGCQTLPAPAEPCKTKEVLPAAPISGDLIYAIAQPAHQ